MSRPFGPSRSGGLALGLSLLLVACARSAEPELHNIPDDFTGRVFLEDTPEHRADDSVAVYNRHSLVVSSPDTPCPVEVECYSVGTQAALLDDPADERAERAWLLEYLKQHAVQCSRRHGRRRRLLAVTAPRP